MPASQRAGHDAGQAPSILARGLALVARRTARCQLCGRAVPRRHPHILDVGNCAVLCACIRCRAVFDHARQR
jgi:hypothetical protein